MGFSNEYIKNIQSLKGEYFCPVCRNLACPDESFQTKCSHLYCKPCLALVAQTTKICPYDGLLVSEVDSKPLLESDMVLADTIWQVTVRCLFEKSGCTWEGPMGECVSHTSRCIFGSYPVICNDCRVEMAHRHIHEHNRICIPKQAPFPSQPQPRVQHVGQSQLELYNVHSQPQTYAPQLQVGTQPVSQGMEVLLDYASVPHNQHMPQAQIQAVGQPQSFHYQVASCTHPQTQSAYAPLLHPQPYLEAAEYTSNYSQPLHSQIASHATQMNYNVQPYIHEAIPQPGVLMPQYEQPRPWLHSNVQHCLHPQTHHQMQNCCEPNPHILVEERFSPQSHPPQGQLFIPDSVVPQRSTLIPLQRPMLLLQSHPPLSLGLHQGPLNQVRIPSSHDNHLGNPRDEWVVMSPSPPQLIPLQRPLIPLQRPLLPLQPPQRLNNGMMPVGIPLLVPQDIAGQLRPSNPTVENLPPHGQEIFVQLPSPKQSQDETLKTLERHLFSPTADHDINGRNSEPKPSTKFEDSCSSPPPGFPVPAFRHLSSEPLPTQQGQAQGLVGVAGGHIDANKAHSSEERSKSFNFPNGVQPGSGVNLVHPRGGKPPLPRKPVAQRASDKTNRGNMQAYPLLNNGPGEGSYPDGVDLFNPYFRKRNRTSIMCEICNIGCDTMEGLDLHFQTEQHRMKRMAIVSLTKQDSLKKHKLSSDHQSLKLGTIPKE